MFVDFRKDFKPHFCYSKFYFFKFAPLSSLCSYEVQLESRVRRKGLGKFLIQILQLIANR